jgi:quercetin dioxygenase-like cupin family protein
MFEKRSSGGYKQAVAGVRQKTLVYGDNSLMAEFLLEKDTTLPLHSHPHEQIGYLVKGQIRLTIGKEVHLVMPGDSWCITGDVLHCAEAIEESVAVEVFAPVREDYLPLGGK